MEMKTKNVSNYKRTKKTITFDISSIERKNRKARHQMKPSEDINKLRNEYANKGIENSSIQFVFIYGIIWHSCIF